MIDFIDFINGLSDATRYAFMEAQPLFWIILDFLVELFTDMEVYEDGSIG